MSVSETKHTESKLIFERQNDKTTGFRGISLKCGTLHIANMVFSLTDNEIANARRLVACWNALEGIPTDALEAEDSPHIAASEQIGQLERENAELRADARRYRWLRNRPSLIGWDWWPTSVDKSASITPEFMDAAIDKELAKP
jgi:hypothetical protein